MHTAYHSGWHSVGGTVFSILVFPCNASDDLPPFRALASLESLDIFNLGPAALADVFDVKHLHGDRTAEVALTNLST